MANETRTIYVGVTNNLERRVYEHKTKLVPDFTERYGLDSLVFYEVTGSVMAAITREKELRGWLRARKVALVSAMNPEWKDLSLDWGKPDAPSRHSEGSPEESET